jgi:type VI secretion system protein ImpH
MGLTGPLGALPYPYVELLIDEVSRHGRRIAVAFLDLLNHRLISLFYRAWEKHHPIIAYERGLAHQAMIEPPPAVSVAPGWPPRSGPDDPSYDLPPSTYLFYLIGLGSPAARHRHAFPDRVLLFYAGLFAQQHRPAVVLERMLGDYFQVPIAVRQFQGQWLRLDPPDRTALGARHNELGNGCLLGRRIWDEQSKIRLTLGPLSLHDYLRFLPDTAAFRSLGQLTRLYVHLELDIEVQLILRAEDVPELRLDPVPGRKPRLGRTTWLNTPHPRRDADEPVFPVPKYH